MRYRTVQGVGINDADYPVGQGKCPYYQTWLSMLQRCYNPSKQKLWPNYVGCSVVPEWHLFSTFKSWMQQQDWQSKALDKDLRVPGNKTYGPDTCLFVSQKINTLLNSQPNRRGDLPLGVTRHGDRFKVNFQKNRKTFHLGVYDTPEEASCAYREAKAAWVEDHISHERCTTTQAVLARAAQQLRKGP